MEPEGSEIKQIFTFLELEAVGFLLKKVLINSSIVSQLTD